MSAARSRREVDRHRVEVGHRRPEMGRLRERRRQARRRRRLARLDLGIGLGAAVALFIVTPGLAITAVIALLTLLACAMSIVLERRHASGKPLLRRARGVGRARAGRRSVRPHGPQRRSRRSPS